MAGISLEPKKMLFVMNNLACGGAERVGVQIINHLDPQKYKTQLVLFESVSDFLDELTYPAEIKYLNKKSRWDFFKLIFARIRN